LDRLIARGLEVAAVSGASLSPFPAAGLSRPGRPGVAAASPSPVRPPESSDAEAWQLCRERLAESVASRVDYDDPALGPQLLAVRSGSRGSVAFLVALLGCRGQVTDAGGSAVGVYNGLVDGLTPREYYACAAGARRGLAQVVLQTGREPYELAASAAPKGFGVLARAVRAGHPGIVFAQAAAAGEVDPLTDLDSRLFVGLAPM
jgi:hypothetical protein